MAKKTAVNENEAATEETYEEVENEGDGLEGLTDLDFDVTDEYRPDPLIYPNLYHGIVQNVKFDKGTYSIVWHVQLQDNGGFMNDDETPVDGAVVYFRNWLPRPGDETEMTKSGKSTKRQSKINILNDFQAQMEIDMSTSKKIATAITEAEWVGLEVDIEVGVDTWNGKTRNTVNRMRRAA